jgi:hypothetical protein
LQERLSLDITTNAGAIDEILYEIYTPSTPEFCSGDNYCIISAYEMGK